MEESIEVLILPFSGEWKWSYAGREWRFLLEDSIEMICNWIDTIKPY